MVDLRRSSTHGIAGEGLAEACSNIERYLTLSGPGPRDLSLPNEKNWTRSSGLTSAMAPMFCTRPVVTSMVISPESGMMPVSSIPFSLLSVQTDTRLVHVPTWVLVLAWIF